jgi:hypothetical protein
MSQAKAPIAIDDRKHSHVDLWLTKLLKLINSNLIMMDDDPRPRALSDTRHAGSNLGLGLESAANVKRYFVLTLVRSSKRNPRRPQ